MLRDSTSGPEVLLIQRAARLRTHGGQWAFPGGAVDAADRSGTVDDLAAARAAARRETAEEIGLALDPASLIPLSHWTTPDGAPTIFRTWFFVAAAPPAPDLVLAADEVAAASWHRPEDATAAHRAGHLPLPVPQFVTLHQLGHAASVQGALDRAAARQPHRFHGRATTVADGLVWRYEGDEAWEHGDLERAGPRRRMWMIAGGWRFEDTSGPHT